MSRGSRRTDKPVRRSYEKRTGRRAAILAVLLALSVMINLAAWISPSFPDWYTDQVFSYISAPLAHFSDLFPFSLGEWLLWAAVIWVLAFAAVLAAALVIRLALPKRRNVRKGHLCFFGFTRKFTAVTLETAIIVLLIMTLNCVILYHVTPLEHSLKGYGKTYSVDELASLRDYVVEECNTLSRRVPRDAQGEVCYAGGCDAMAQKAREAIAEEARLEGGAIAPLSRLSGWSVTPKPLLASSFVSQQYMQGYYFPFSMEANYNSVMKIMNIPFTMCHELSHTHGFIYEDEANLIGFLACIHSDDPVFQYSGWLGVLNYVDNSFYENVGRSEYLSHPAISDQVRSDNEFLSEDAWQQVEENAVVSTETARAATDAYLDNTLKANGVGSGKASYSHVTGLLLEYYDD